MLKSFMGIQVKAKIIFVIKYYLKLFDIVLSDSF